MVPPTVGGCSRLNYWNQDNPPQVCLETHLSDDSRFCQVDNEHYYKSHHLCDSEGIVSTERDERGKQLKSDRMFHVKCWEVCII